MCCLIFFLETVVLFFHDWLMKSSHSIYSNSKSLIKCNSVLTLTFAQVNASLLNVSIHLFKKKLRF